MSTRTTGATGDADGGLELGAALRGVWRRRRWVVLPTLAALLGTVAFVHLVPPRYTAEARLLIENRESFYTRPEREARPGGEVIDAEAVQSQVQILTSRDLAREVSRELDLGARAEFDPLLGGLDPLKRALVMLGLMRNPTNVAPNDRVLEAYYERVTVFPAARSRVIAVEFSSRDPDLAARGANAVAATYLRFQRGAKTAGTRSAEGWLAGAIEPLRRRVAEAEARVEAYRSGQGLLVGSNSTTIVGQQLADLNAGLASARAAAADLAARAKVVRDAAKAGRFNEISETANNDGVRRLNEQRATLRAQLAQEERTLLSGHPRIKELRAQADALDGQLRLAADRAARVLDNDARAAAARVTGLSAELDQQKGRAAEANGSEVQLKALEREAKAEREQLETLLAKYRDAGSREGGEAAIADARVISQAMAPSDPSFPKKGPTILVVTLAAFVASLAAALSRELLAAPAPRGARPAAEPRFEDGALASDGAVAPRTRWANDEGAIPADERAAAALPDTALPDTASLETALAEDGLTDRARETDHGDVRAHSAARAYGSERDEDVARAASSASPSSDVDRPASSAPGAVGGAPRPPAPRPAGVPLLALPALVDDLAARAHAAKPLGRGALVGVASSGRGEGATTLAVALGRALAREGSAVLVDLDGEGAGFADLAGARRPLGVSDMLRGRATFGDALHRDRGSRLHLMPRGQASAERDPALLAPLLEALTRAYDHVVLDLGPAAGAPGTALAACALTALVGSEDGRGQASAGKALLAAGATEVLAARVTAPPLAARAANDAGVGDLVAS